MPQRSSWLAGQMLINQHLTDLAILAEVRRQTPKISRKLIFGVFSHSLFTWFHFPVPDDQSAADHQKRSADKRYSMSRLIPDWLLIVA